MEKSMKKEWLKPSSGRWSNTPIVKVYPTEKIQVGESEVIVRNDKNYQIIEVVNYPELTSAIRGRMFLLEIDRIHDYAMEHPLPVVESKEEEA